MLLGRSGLKSPAGNPSRFSRFFSVAVPAGAVTLGLFVAMQNLIRVEGFEAPELASYELAAFIETPKTSEPDPPPRKFVRPEIVDPPAPPPQLVNDIDAPKVPISSYDGAAPADYGEADLNILKPRRATAVIDRIFQPVSPPVPVYPRKAAKDNIEGECDVFLSVSRQGDPYDIRADCTHPVFKAAAEKAIRKVKFVPKIRDGLPVIVTGVVYPLEFALEP